MHKQNTQPENGKQGLVQDLMGRGGDSPRRPGPPASSLVGHAPTSPGATCSCRPYVHPPLIDQEPCDCAELEEISAAVTTPAISTLTASGHYHTEATGTFMLGPDREPCPNLRLTNCLESHQVPRKGKSIEACELGLWGFAYWLRENMPEPVGRAGIVPTFTLSGVKGGVTRFRCKSWRHVGECRDFVFKRDFSRIMTALESRPAWLYCVLTINRRRWKSGKASAYKNFWRRWQQLRQRLSRHVGDRKIEYVSVMEQHASGWPHMNLILYWEDMEKIGGLDELEIYAQQIERWMKDNAPSCGLGHSVYVDAVNSHKTIAGYFTKQAMLEEGNGPIHSGADLRRVAGEINKQSKGYQIPMAAPLGFRRIRSSRGLLPSIETDSDYSGAIHNPNRKDGEGKPDESSEPGALVASEVGSGAPDPRAVRGPGQSPGRKRYRLERRQRIIDAAASEASGSERIELFTASNWATPARREWWAIARVTRAAMERADVDDIVIRDEILKLKEIFFRGRKIP